MPPFSSSAGERKLMTHFVVKRALLVYLFGCGVAALGVILMLLQKALDIIRLPVKDRPQQIRVWILRRHAGPIG